jgi:hypothetical protein
MTAPAGFCCRRGELRTAKAASLGQLAVSFAPVAAASWNATISHRGSDPTTTIPPVDHRCDPPAVAANADNLET